MEITKTYNWISRDFWFDCKCEHCGTEEKNISGYGDSYYYNEVIPAMKCNKCGESSNSKISDEMKSIIIPKYDPNIVM